jgi:hypothetical protein
MTDVYDEDPEEPREDEEGRKRAPWGRLEQIIPELLKRAVAQGAGALGDEKAREHLVAEVLRKAISKGGEVVEGTEDSVRRLLGELPLPKEVVERMTSRLDDYKSELFKLLRQEVHEFFSRIDLGHELQKALTSLSFEITTEIRFVPNEKSVGGAGVKPDMKTDVKMKRAEGEERRSRRSRQPKSSEE